MDFVLLKNLLVNICGQENVICEYVHVDTAESINEYSSLNFHIYVKPASSIEIASILNLCNLYKIPIIPRGGGTNVTGGDLPTNNGIVLSLERLNKIINIDLINQFVVAESGVITADLCKAVEALGLYFPVIPTSCHSSFIGGNVATNAGSIYSYKYGKTERYVINLEVVLPNGQIIWTSSNVSKITSGLNLTQIFVGSEGTLGIITKVVYKLIPKPLYEIVILAGFDKLLHAYNSVVSIKNSQLSPSGVELICSNALQLTSKYINKPLPLVENNINAHLLIEYNCYNINDTYAFTRNIKKILKTNTNTEILIANSTIDIAELRLLRNSIGLAMTSNYNSYRDIDTCIPISEVYNYIIKIESICETYKVPLVCFGHVLDGNLHTMLLKNKILNSEEEHLYNKATFEIYAYANSIGGALSGEHGIGTLQRDFLEMFVPEYNLFLMKQMKTIFDPNEILSPGKSFCQ